MTINDLKNDVRFLTNTDISSYPDEVLIRNVNFWYNQVVSWIWKHTGTWGFSDKNHTTLSFATTNLEHEQQDYELPTVAQKVERIEILSKEGTWEKLMPIDKSQINVALPEYHKTPGMPLFYDLTGWSIVLYPKPSQDDVTLLKGLKAYVSRGIIEFLVSDTIKEPGFTKNFHRILSLGAAMDFCMVNELRNKERNYRKQIFGGGTTLGLKEELQNFYKERHREGMQQIETRASIIPSVEDYK